MEGKIATRVALFFFFLRTWCFLAIAFDFYVSGTLILLSLFSPAWKQQRFSFFFFVGVILEAILPFKNELIFLPSS